MFERYTPAAKLAIYMANLEAKHRDELAIGPSYILAGLMTDGCLPPEKSTPLRSLRITLRALLGIPHRPSTAFPYARAKGLPLDPDGRAVIRFAESEADSDWSYWIDTHHLLRALLCFPNETSAALGEVGLDLNKVRRAPRQFRSEPAWTPVPLKARLKLFAARNSNFLWGPILLLALALLLVLVLKARGPL